MTHNPIALLLPLPDAVDRMTEEARACRDAAARQGRAAFQARHPHYTPPPGSSEVAWVDWVNSNVKLHGLLGPGGFYDRFPEAKVHALRETSPPASQCSLWDLLSDMARPTFHNSPPHRRKLRDGEK